MRGRSMGKYTPIFVSTPPFHTYSNLSLPRLRIWREQLQVGQIIRLSQIKQTKFEAV